MNFAKPQMGELTTIAEEGAILLNGSKEVEALRPTFKWSEDAIGGAKRDKRWPHHLNFTTTCNATWIYLAQFQG